MKQVAGLLLIKHAYSKIYEKYINIYNLKHTDSSSYVFINSRKGIIAYTLV